VTLHVAFLSPAFVLQVGDRLLTVGKPGNASQWDAYANKTLIVDAIDGCVCISYAGLAHIAGQPTDEWLARALTKAVWPLDGLLTTRLPSLGLTLGNVCGEIIRAIERDFLMESDANRALHIEVLIAGWSWKPLRNNGRRGPATFARMISHDGSLDRRCTVTSIPPMPFEERSTRWRYLAIGKTDIVDERCNNLKELYTQDPPRADLRADDIEEILVSDIRAGAAALGGDVIGTECMAVYLPLRTAIRVRFFRDPTLAETKTGFTPWYINTFGSVAKPGYLTGTGWTIGSRTMADEMGPVISFEVVPPLPGGNIREWGPRSNRPLN